MRYSLLINFEEEEEVLNIIPSPVAVLTSFLVNEDY